MSFGTLGKGRSRSPKAAGPPPCRPCLNRPNFGTAQNSLGLLGRRRAEPRQCELTRLMTFTRKEIHNGRQRRQEGQRQEQETEGDQAGASSEREAAAKVSQAPFTGAARVVLCSAWRVRCPGTTSSRACQRWANATFDVASRGRVVPCMFPTSC